MSTVVGVLVALAALAFALPSRTRGRSVRRWPSSAVLPRGRPGRAPGVSAGRVRDRTHRRGAGGAPPGGGGDLAGVLHGVVAQLRAGAPAGDAWTRVLGAPVQDQAPGVATLLGVLGTGGRDTAPDLHARVRAVAAGARVAADTGAPLADVLEDLADAVAADAEQAGERAAALAGPRATARVLVLLPALGLLVGAAMGARPWEVLVDGGLGTLLALTGVALVVAGHVWTGALLRRAADP